MVFAGSYRQPISKVSGRAPAPVLNRERPVYRHHLSRSMPLRRQPECRRHPSTRHSGSTSRVPGPTQQASGCKRRQALSSRIGPVLGLLGRAVVTSERERTSGWDLPSSHRGRRPDIQCRAEALAPNKPVSHSVVLAARERSKWNRSSSARCRVVPELSVVCWVMDGASPLASDNLKLFLRFQSG